MIVSEEFTRAKQYHYDYHSRQFPIEECAVQDCKKAVRKELVRQGKRG